MDIKHLQYFIEVTNFNSFSRAADHLFITQPAISKMVKNLEGELVVALFDRSRKKLMLTDAGHIILGQAKLIDKEGVSKFGNRIRQPSWIKKRPYPNWITASF